MKYVVILFSFLFITGCNDDLKIKTVEFKMDIQKPIKGLSNKTTKVKYLNICFNRDLTPHEQYRILITIETKDNIKLKNKGSDYISYNIGSDNQLCNKLYIAQLFIPKYYQASDDNSEYYKISNIVDNRLTQDNIKRIKIDILKETAFSGDQILSSYTKEF